MESLFRDSLLTLTNSRLSEADRKEGEDPDDYVPSERLSDSESSEEMQEDQKIEEEEEEELEEEEE